VRKTILFLGLFSGAVALIVGIAGLLTPVSVSPEDKTVSCGTAVAPDLSEARANDDRSAANVPILGEVEAEVVADINYTRLCQMDIEDRRIWTISLAGVGAFAVATTLGLRAWWKRAPPSQ
jgi:hypothetical protein